MANIDTQNRDEEAAYWCSVWAAGRLSDEDMRNFSDWMQASADNAQAFSRVSMAWSALPEFREPDVSIEPAVVTKTGAGNRRMFQGFAAGVVCLVVLVAAATLLANKPMHYVGDRHAIRVVALQDGSTLTLDAAAEVEVKYTNGERQLQLKAGRAEFAVAKDPRRPFVVLIDDRAVKAVGTEFSIDRGADRTTVDLIEGRLQAFDNVNQRSAFDDLRSSNAVPDSTIAAGQRITWVQGTEKGVVADASMKAARGWAMGQLVFEDTPLRDAVAIINRYGERQIRLGMGVDGALPISGIFKAGDSRTFLDAVRAVGGLSYTEDDNGYILLPPHHKPN